MAGIETAPTALQRDVGTIPPASPVAPLLAHRPATPTVLGELTASATGTVPQPGADPQLGADVGTDLASGPGVGVDRPFEPWLHADAATAPDATTGPSSDLGVGIDLPTSGSPSPLQRLMKPTRRGEPEIGALGIATPAARASHGAPEITVPTGSRGTVADPPGLRGDLQGAKPPSAGLPMPLQRSTLETSAGPSWRRSGPLQRSSEAPVAPLLSGRPIAAALEPHEGLRSPLATAPVTPTGAPRAATAAAQPLLERHGLPGPGSAAPDAAPRQVGALATGSGPGPSWPPAASVQRAATHRPPAVPVQRAATHLPPAASLLRAATPWQPTDRGGTPWQPTDPGTNRPHPTQARAAALSTGLATLDGNGAVVFASPPPPLGQPAGATPVQRADAAPAQPPAQPPTLEHAAAQQPPAEQAPRAEAGDSAARSHPALSEASSKELDELARRLYPRISRHLKREWLLSRERVGLSADLKH